MTELTASLLVLIFCFLVKLLTDIKIKRLQKQIEELTSEIERLKRFQGLL